jgi:hypothetical protein
MTGGARRRAPPEHHMPQTPELVLARHALAAAEARGAARAFRDAMTPWSLGEDEQHIPAKVLLWLRCQAEQHEATMERLLKSASRCCMKP